jgi:hypothetical protein
VRDLDRTAERLRQAIAQGSYEEARQALLLYAGQLADLLMRLDPSDPTVSQTVNQASDLLERTRRQACADHAHTRAQLAQLSSVLPYREFPDGSARTWQLNA